MGANDSFTELQRGFRAEAAMRYLGLKRRAFDAVKDQLQPIRSGASKIYDRHDLDALFERLKARSASSQSAPLRISQRQTPMEVSNPAERRNAKKSWLAQQAFIETNEPVDTGPTRGTVVFDYATISRAIKQRKSG